MIATSRNPSKTPELVAEVERNGGKWLQLDVDDRDSGRVVEELEKAGTTIDVLVNNAGYSIFAPIEASTEDEVRAQMESMYFGPLRLIRAVLPHLRARRFGVIVNMSSGAALEGRDTMGPYAGAKAGLDGMPSLLTIIAPLLPHQPFSQKCNALIDCAAATKVLAKEVATYNIRTLTAVLGTFNTSFGGNASFGATSLPAGYAGSGSEAMIRYLKEGKVPINGDKDKAMRAVYEVVVGEGVGVGLEAEKFLPLGTDMTDRVKLVRDSLDHALRVFGHVTDHVGIEK